MRLARLVVPLGTVPFGIVPLVAAALAGAPARAQSTSFADQIDDVRQAVGLGRTQPPIDFTPRAPIVVPPTYTLPPPGNADPEHISVNDPDVAARRRALTDPRRPVPPSVAGAAASGSMARPYLVDPPSGMRDPQTVAADITHDTAPATIPHAKAKPAHHRRKAAADAAAQ